MGLVGLSNREVFAGLVGADGPIDSLLAAYKTHAWAFREAGLYPEAMFEGAAELIADLRQRTNCRLAIATGKGRRGTDLILKQQGWTDAFSSIQTSDDCPSKPDPAMILRALAATSVQPADAVMIGDSVFDMQMALAAGVTPIGVAWGHQPATRLHAAGAAIIAEDFADLARLLG
jgi:phosphoglycolate phosphatase